MNELLEFLKNVPELIVTLEALLLAMIAFFMLIPGRQPETFLQKVVDFIKKFSRK